MNFVKTIWNVVRNPSCFPLLAQKSIWKALFYYLFLAFLLAFLFSCLESCSINREIRESCTFIFERTGGFRFGKDGITTIKTPEEKKEYEITTSRGKLRMDYLPGAILTPDEIKGWPDDTLYGVILMRNGVMSWTKYSRSEDRYLVMATFLEKNFDSSLPAVQLLDTEEFASFVKKAGKDGKGSIVLREEFRDGQYTDPMLLSRILEAFTAFGNWGILLIQYVVFGLFTVAFFVLVQLFRMGPGGKRLPLRVNCVITLFAALPGLIAGAVFQSFHIVFLDFQNVFLIVFFVYDILAFNAYYRSFGKTENHTEEDGNDEK